MGRDLSQIGAKRLRRTTLSMFSIIMLSPSLSPFYLTLQQAHSSCSFLSHKIHTVPSVCSFPASEDPHKHIPINARAELFSLHHLLLFLYCKVTQGISGCLNSYFLLSLHRITINIQRLIADACSGNIFQPEDKTSRLDKFYLSICVLALH